MGILRRPSIPPAIFFMLLSYYTPLVAADDFNCLEVNIGSEKFNLSSLNTEQKITRTRITPPTTMVDTLIFNICDSLKPQEDISESDQCPSGTRACLTIVNQKQGADNRIISVIPVAQGDLDAQFSTLSSPSGISILLHGSSYPNDSSDSKKQSFKLNLTCSESASEPKFLSYDESQVEAQWTHPAACASKGNEDKGSDNGGDSGSDNKEREGSGIGWFFLVLLLAFLAYFGLGAYHNYATYGATGLDLIPHRDFWQEVPYMLRDVAAHLCSSVRPRRSASRGGYIAV